MSLSEPQSELFVGQARFYYYIENDGNWGQVNGAELGTGQNWGQVNYVQVHGLIFR